MLARFRRAVIVLAITCVCGTLATVPTSHGWTHSYTACITEDSSGPCYWDATQHGNGLGHSFLVTPDQKVIYVSER